MSQFFLHQIPNAETAAIAAIVDTTSLQASANANRNCGRRFNFDAIENISITMCSKFENHNKSYEYFSSLICYLGKVVPFRVGVHFDGFEVCSIAQTSGCEHDVVATIDTGGITGFQLTYWQSSC